MSKRIGRKVLEIQKESKNNLFRSFIDKTKNSLTINFDVEI